MSVGPGSARRHRPGTPAARTLVEGVRRGGVEVRIVEILDRVHADVGEPPGMDLVVDLEQPRTAVVLRPRVEAALAPGDPERLFLEVVGPRSADDLLDVAGGGR